MHLILPLTVSLPVVVEAVAPGVTLAAEGGLRRAPALILQSRPGHVPAHPAPAPKAAPAPTHDPGVQTHIYTYIHSRS